jgi:hypothetical protein
MSTTDRMMPVILHRGCDRPLHWEAVQYYDGLGLTWVCPLHGAVPTFEAAIQGEDTAPIRADPVAAHQQWATDKCWTDKLSAVGSTWQNWLRLMPLLS